MLVTAVVLSALALTGVTTGSVATAAASCHGVTVAGALAPGLPKDQSIYGQYCSADSSESVLQVLVHGGTYDHTYWDFRGFGGRYSYVEAMNRAGYATLAIDQLGVGRSSHPPSVLTTQNSLAHGVHEVVQAARSGALGRRWDKIILVGHSFGTLTSFLEAGTYSDVDGLIATGASHNPGAGGIGAIFSRVRPALLDPATRDEVPPGDLGYLSVVGARAAAFYDAANSDPAVIAADEATRRPGTVGVAATIPEYIPATRGIKVPVLLANGGHDKVFCAQGGGRSLTDCADDAALYAAEKPFFPAAELQTYVLPHAGHSANMALNSQDLFARMLTWVRDHS
jgi:pimeloyl-ACP methyl ester carboxylesterase